MYHNLKDKSKIWLACLPGRDREVLEQKCLLGRDRKGLWFYAFTIVLYYVINIGILSKLFLNSNLFQLPIENRSTLVKLCISKFNFYP